MTLQSLWWGGGRLACENMPWSAIIDKYFPSAMQSAGIIK